MILMKKHIMLLFFCLSFCTQLNKRKRSYREFLEDEFPTINKESIFTLFGPLDANVPELSVASNLEPTQNQNGLQMFEYVRKSDEFCSIKEQGSQGEKDLLFNLANKNTNEKLKPRMPIPTVTHDNPQSFKNQDSESLKNKAIGNFINILGNQKQGRINIQQMQNFNQNSDIAKRKKLSAQRFEHERDEQLKNLPAVTMLSESDAQSNTMQSNLFASKKDEVSNISSLYLPDLNVNSNEYSINYTNSFGEKDTKNDSCREDNYVDAPNSTVYLNIQGESPNSYPNLSCATNFRGSSLQYRYHLDHTHNFANPDLSNDTISSNIQSEAPLNNLDHGFLFTDKLETNLKQNKLIKKKTYEQDFNSDRDEINSTTNYFD
ncbi:hypothetical protein H311_01167, partial [Anncaliia algerae PRA109]